LRLAELFERLPVPIPGRDRPTFSTLLLGEGPHRLGKDIHGAPALLVATDAAAGGVPPAPIELEHVRVMYDVQCLLWHWSESFGEALFTLVQCLTSDRTLCGYFLSVIEGVVPLLGPRPSDQSVHEVVRSIAELFRALTLPAKKSVQGLWAELFMITESSDPCSTADAWHATPSDAYDFSAADQRIETKSSGNRERRHHFTLEQLHPPHNTQVLVASLFVERAGAGTSLKELLDRLRVQISREPELLLRIEQLVAVSLGISWQNALDQRFDIELARESLRFFDARRVPSVDPQLPKGVSDVRFVSDLKDTSQLALKTLLDTPGLFRNIVPLHRLERRAH